MPPRFPPGGTEERLARLEAEVEGTRREVEIYAPTVRTVIEASLRLEDVVRDLGDLKVWIRDVERRLDNRILAVTDSLGKMQTGLEEDRKTERRLRIERWWRLVLSVVAAVAVIAAAFIGAKYGTH